MKNSVKLFVLLVFSLFLFSCSADEQDADLERAIKMSENIFENGSKQDLERVDNKTSDSLLIEDGTPIVIIKKG